MDYSNATNEQLEQLFRCDKDGEAMCELAERFLNGSKGKPRKPQQAYMLFEKAEKQKMKRAYKGLGDMYAGGIYVVQNDEKAREYYEKAGISPNSNPNTASSPASNSGVTVDTDHIQQLLANGENSRQQGAYDVAEKCANDILSFIQNGRSGVKITGNGDLDVLEIEAYWLLAFTAFNRGNYQQMDTYLAYPGVTALHPWGVYLSAMIHKENGAPRGTLENDMEQLLNVRQNQNLTGQEQGDVLSQIADLYLEGIHCQDGDAIQLAYNYYSDAAQCGNDYAVQQRGKFQKVLTGKMKYIG